MLVACAVVSLLLVSVFGTFLNTYLFYEYLAKSGAKTTFMKLCILKTVPNTIVCLVFLLWVVPLTALSISCQDIPLSVNRYLGQLSGFGAYVAGPLIQMFMAFNRCFVIFFPMKTLIKQISRAANLVIVVIVIIAALFAGVGVILPSCGFVYDPELLQWKAEESECAFEMGLALFFTVIVLTAVSNTLNFFTFAKLCVDAPKGLSNETIIRRRRQRVRLFAQSVIQDCLHVVDMINYNIIAPLDKSPWFQFVFISMSLLLIHALDGFVMWLFHSNISSNSRVTNVKTVSVLPAPNNS